MNTVEAGRNHGNNFILWLVIGYMFLFIFRPYEYWAFLGTLRIERIYMIFLVIMVLMNESKHYIHSTITVAVIGFFVVMVAATVFAFNFEDAFPATFDYFKILVFYFVIILTLRDEEDLKYFVIAYLIIMFLYIGRSAWEFFVNDRFWWRMGIKRMMGIDITYADPNYFAASIAYSLPFWWAMIKYRAKNHLFQLFLWGYGALAFTCIIYSGSRSGMVTALLMIMMAWLASKRKILGIALIPVFLAGIWFAMPDSYKIRFESTFVMGIAEEAGQKGADESAQGRLVGLKMGFDTFLKYPILGIGPRNFKYAWAGVTGEVIGGSAHNLYGQLLGEMGGCGAIAFAFFIFAVIKTHNHVRRRSNTIFKITSKRDHDNQERAFQLLKILSIASIQAIILLLFNGNFGHNLYRFNYLWIAAIGVICNYILKRKEMELDFLVAGKSTVKQSKIIADHQSLQY